MTNTVKRPKAAAVPRTPPTIEKYELIKSKNKELTQVKKKKKKKKEKGNFPHVILLIFM
jgi:hypothetical protein